MKEVKQPVSMQVTEEQYRKDLEKPLKDLGYSNDTEWNLSHNPNAGHPYLLTHKDHKKWGFYSHRGSSHFKIDHYNPKLFLAIAGMTEGEDWCVGEWLVTTEEYTKLSPHCPEIFEVLAIRSCTCNAKLGYASNEERYKKYFRKATLEELVKYFKESSKTENMNKKEVNFPYTINQQEADEIFKIACGGEDGWKTKLAKKWGVDLMLKSKVEVSEEFYLQMRSACSSSQHKVLDNIFGEQKPKYIPKTITFVIESEEEEEVIQKLNGFNVTVCEELKAYHQIPKETTNAVLNKIKKAYNEI